LLISCSSIHNTGSGKSTISAQAVGGLPIQPFGTERFWLLHAPVTASSSITVGGAVQRTSFQTNKSIAPRPCQSSGTGNSPVEKLTTSNSSDSPSERRSHNLSAELRYLFWCGLGAGLGLVGGISVARALSLSHACAGITIGVFLAGFVAIVPQKKHVEMLGIALWSLMCSIAIGGGVGLIGGAASVFSWQCLILGFWIGLSISTPMAAHALVYYLLEDARRRKGGGNRY